MKILIGSFLVFTLFISSCSSNLHTSENQSEDNVITSDIYNFWKAYDKITSTTDSTLQYRYLDSLYFQKGTAGLESMREAKNYSAQDYIDAINEYPDFWNSVRKNMLGADQCSSELHDGIVKLRAIYPQLKPAKIYFTVGAMRSGGTYVDSLVLIGSEFAMADQNTVSSEFPKEVQDFRRVYFDSNPIEDIVLLNVHEYVHTQQHPQVYNMLSLAIREGVAEFVSCKAMGVASSSTSVIYGKENPERVRDKFEEEMFYNYNLNKWLWSDAVNEFNVRDLAYYIGYQMCEIYYEKTENKKGAIKKLIELDYENEEEIENFVNGINYFSAPLDDLYKDFENKRPTVARIRQFENGSQDVSPSIKEITIEFSEALSGTNTGIDFGELGKDAFPKNDITKRYWSEDKKAWTIPVDLEPNKQYQLLFTNNFRTDDNRPMKPFLVEFKTNK